MTDSDDKLLRRYRELAREEPARALDDAILAASRRAVARPSWSRRFAAPVSIAAVLVLAFGVTLEMQREEPGVEYTAPARNEPAVVPAAPAVQRMEAPQAMEAGVEAPRQLKEKKQEAKPAAKQAPAESRSVAAPPPMKPLPDMNVQETASTVRVEPPAPFAKEARPAPEAFVPSPQSAPAAPAASMDAVRRANVAPAIPASPPTPATAGAMAAPRAKAEMSQSANAPARASAADSASVPSSEPERELERIAKLREDHRDEEADKAFAEFKRKYPAFQIPDAMLPRVRPR